MKTILFLSICSLIIFIYACGTPKMSQRNEIVEHPDVEAQFGKGPESLKRYIALHTEYPDVAMERGEEGKVFVEFVVEKDGSITTIKVLKGVTEALDKEAIRMVSEMPNWTPAIYEGKYVRAKVRFPINYVLR